MSTATEKQAPAKWAMNAAATLFKAADEIAAEYIAQKRAANWDIVNNAYVDAERVLRELGVAV